MNAIKTRPGMVYVTFLVIVICSIAFLPGTRRPHPLHEWPEHIVTPYRDFVG